MQRGRPCGSRRVRGELRNGAPDWNRTSNRRLRRPMLYPIELRAHRWRILTGNHRQRSGMIAPGRVEVEGSLAPFPALALRAIARWRAIFAPPSMAPQSNGAFSRRRQFSSTLHPMTKTGHKGPLLSLVGAEGFEPPTSSSQSWRSTRLSYTPKRHRRSQARPTGHGTFAGSHGSTHPDCAR